MNNILITIISAFWIVLPAYIANSSAVIFHGTIPIDLGKFYKDNERIFGNGKTIRGFIGGVVAGTLIGYIMMNFINFEKVPKFTIPVIVALVFGAMLGDLTKSFIKRRLHLPQSDKLFLDSIDFIIGAFVLLMLVDFSWFSNYVTPYVLAIVFIATPICHRIANIIGYKINIKKVPW